MPKEFSRASQLSGYVQKNLAMILQLEMKDPRLGMVTVSEVSLSRDLSYADVYVSFLNLDSEENIKQAISILQQASGFLRKRLSEKITMRTSPQLRFHYDKTITHGRYISNLIDKVIAEDNQRKDANRAKGDDSREA